MQILSSAISPSQVSLPPDSKLIKVSERGVVFFRAQKGFTLEQQKILSQKLGELTGKPETSGLHIHPVNNAGRGGAINERGEINHDNEVSVISSEHNRKLGIIQNIYADKFASDGWHSEYISLQNEADKVLHLNRCQLTTRF
jgi:hypothetical protein